MTATLRPSPASRPEETRPCGSEGSARAAPAVAVHVLRGGGDWPAEAEAIVTRAVRAALAVEDRAPRRGEIAVLLTDDAALADLNRRFRHREGPTDVLSFPGESRAGDAAAHIGDIAIAHERCIADAAALGRPLAFHLAHLVIHGVLHCLGHDHERDEEARVMESRERAALAALGWGDPYPADDLSADDERGGER